MRRRRGTTRKLPVYSKSRILRVEPLEDRRLLSGAPGDFNNSGIVDAADYTLWQDAVETGAPLANDGQLGTPIGQDHYALWKANYGKLSKFGFTHVNQVGAEDYLVDSTGMRKYSEWQNPPLTYWGPAANGVEGRLVYKFEFPGQAQSIRLKAVSPCWDFFNEPGGNGRGVSAIEVSKDGATWVALHDNVTPRNWGADWSVDDQLPAAVLGGEALWVRMRFLVESAPNSSYTVAQFGRSTAAEADNVFEMEATLTVPNVNNAPTGVTLQNTTASLAENSD